MIISDSSPLIHLTRLGKINYLLKIASPILIPKAVYDEVIIDGKKENYIEARVIENLINQGEILVKKVTIAENMFNSALGRGELEALELAKQENVLLIVDDRKARNLAQLLEIKYQTTITTIFEILLAKKIDLSEYKTNLKKYAEDCWISADIIQEYLDRGEKFG